MIHIYIYVHACIHTQIHAMIYTVERLLLYLQMIVHSCMNVFACVYVGLEENSQRGQRQRDRQVLGEEARERKVSQGKRNDSEYIHD